MKTPPLRFIKTLIVRIALLAGVSSFGSIPATAQQFSVELKSNKSRYLIGEPVFLDVSITYNGQNELILNHPLDRRPYFEDIEVASEGNKEFVRIKTRAEARDELIDRGKLRETVVRKGSVIRRRLVLLGTADSRLAKGDYALIFSRPGRYSVRFVAGFEDKKFSVTTAVSIELPKQRKDRAAWERLKTDRLIDVYCRLDEPYSDDVVNLKMPGELREVVEKYPKSQYANFIRTLTTRSAASTVVKPPPPHPLTDAYKALAAEYYDLRSLSTNRAPWATRMKRRTMEILDKGMLGQMPLEEAHREAGELTKEYIRKYDKPLSKSEWNRRTKIYAEQDAAQKARQRAIQMKNAPENARILKEAIEKHRREQEKNPK